MEEKIENQFTRVIEYLGFGVYRVQGLGLTTVYTRAQMGSSQNQSQILVPLNIRRHTI